MALAVPARLGRTERSSDRRLMALITMPVKGTAGKVMTETSIDCGTLEANIQWIVK